MRMPIDVISVRVIVCVHLPRYVPMNTSIQAPVRVVDPGLLAEGAGAEVEVQAPLEALLDEALVAAHLIKEHFDGGGGCQ